VLSEGRDAASARRPFADPEGLSKEFDRAARGVNLDKSAAGPQLLVLPDLGEIVHSRYGNASLGKSSQRIVVRD
jgi:hypothetical protein